MAITTRAEVGRTGNLLHFIFTDGAGNPQAVTAVTGAPSVFKTPNPKAITLPAPTWASVLGNSQNHTGQKIGLITYFLPSPAIPGDAFTYTALAGWATAGGQAAPAANGATIANYAGLSIETPMAIPDNVITMPVGLDMNWPEGGNTYGNYHAQMNMVKCFPGNASNVTQRDPDNYPRFVNGTVSATIISGLNGNFIDGKTTPILEGDYVLRVTENNIGSPFQMSITTSGTVTSPGGVNPVPTTVGNVRTWAFTIHRTSPAQWNFKVTLNFIPPTAGTVPWTLAKDMVLIRPGDTIGGYTGNTNQASNRIAGMLTSSNGRVPHDCRWNDNIWDFDGKSNAINALDCAQINDFTWNNRVQAGIPILQIRVYDPVRSPTIYMWDSWGGLIPASPGGSVGPYQFTQNNVNWLPFAGGSWNCFEVKTTIPHGFKSGQYPKAPPGLNGIVFQNAGGTYLSGAANGQGPALSNNVNPIWVTGPDTFISTVYGQPTGNNTTFGNAASDQNASGSYIINIPDAGAIAVECACSMSNKLGNDMWLEIPFAAGLDLCTAIAQRVLAALTPGRNLFVEMGNEVWSTQQQGLGFAGTMAKILGFTNAYYTYVYQSKRYHDEIYRVFNLQGRGLELKRVMNSQGPSPSVVTSQIAAANFFNAPFDYVAIAQYVETDTSPSYVAASSAWQIADILDLCRYGYTYNINHAGPASFNAQNLANIAANWHVVVNGVPYPAPKLCGYESSFDRRISWTGTATQTIFNLEGDSTQHPNVYDLDRTHYYLQQKAGLVFSHCNSFCQPAQNGVTIWPIYMWEGMQPGRGDGRGGTPVNQFTTAQGGSPGDALCHYGPDSVNPGNIATGGSYQGGNVSPKAQSVLDWNAAIGGSSPPPSSGIGTITLGTLGVAGVGGFKTQALGTIALHSLTVTAAATVKTTGLGTIALARATVVGAATSSVPYTSGVGTITLGSIIVAGAATCTPNAVTAIGAITLGALAVTATGTWVDHPTGSGAITLGALTASGAATFKAPAIGTITLGALNVASVGTLQTTAAGSIVMSGLGVAGSGTVPGATSGGGAISLGGLAVFGLGAFDAPESITNVDPNAVRLLSTTDATDVTGVDPLAVRLIG